MDCFATLNEVFLLRPPSMPWHFHSVEYLRAMNSVHGQEICTCILILQRLWRRRIGATFEDEGAKVGKMQDASCVLTG